MAAVERSRAGARGQLTVPESNGSRMKGRGETRPLCLNEHQLSVDEVLRNSPPDSNGDELLSNSRPSVGEFLRNSPAGFGETGLHPGKFLRNFPPGAQCRRV